MENLLGKIGTSGESGTLFVTPQLFDRVVSSERALIAIETPRAAELLAQFRHFAVRSGNSIYAWTETDGIASLRESEVSVPGSARLPEALRYIQSSMHFGVYLFHELAAQLRFSPARSQVLGLLRQIGRGKNMGGAVRKVVLIDEQVAFSDGVDELFERLRDEPGSGRRLRLRDGRWVQ
ncbi:MAG TPA: hypothetical protein VFL14_07625 [Xanthomonadales bacterium]|nr:hypothetical protein [Xanthomonadales bacterium]